jgi:hypothetical protein
MYTIKEEVDTGIGRAVWRHCIDTPSYFDACEVARILSHLSKEAGCEDTRTRVEDCEGKALRTYCDGVIETQPM